MKTKKQSKIIAIVVLCVSIIGLTLGFAAFSNTLTISSSAIVSPNVSDFNINVYGIESWTNGVGWPTVDMFTSNSISNPYFEGAKTATPAKISDNGKAISISNISLEMVKPGDYAQYSFLIKNEGEYSAYLDTAILDDLYGGIGRITCTPSKDASPDLVSEACDYISTMAVFEESNGSQILTGGSYELVQDDYILLVIIIGYDDVDSTVRADGDFSIDFEDINLEFTSVPSE